MNIFRSDFYKSNNDCYLTMLMKIYNINWKSWLKIIGRLSLQMIIIYAYIQ